MKSLIKYLSLLMLTFMAPLLAMNPLTSTQNLNMGSSIVVPQRLGDIGIYYRDQEWHIISEGIDHRIGNHFVDPILRNISEEVLEKFFDANGYILVGQFTNGEFNLKANGRLLGGGAG